MTLPDDIAELARMGPTEMLAELDEIERAAREGGDTVAQLAEVRRLLAALIVQAHGFYSRVEGRRLGDGPVTPKARGRPESVERPFG